MASSRVFICRLVVVALLSATLACTLRAPDVGFTALRFRKIGLLVLLLFWHLPRGLYDAAQVFANLPLPPSRMALAALVVFEWVVMVVVFAAASSATGLLVFFQIDARTCGGSPPVRALPGACSHWHVAAAALNLASWIFSAILAGFMFWLGVSVAELE